MTQLALGAGGICSFSWRDDCSLPTNNRFLRLSLVNDNSSNFVLPFQISLALLQRPRNQPLLGLHVQGPLQGTGPYFLQLGDVCLDGPHAVDANFQFFEDGITNLFYRQAKLLRYLFDSPNVLSVAGNEHAAGILAKEHELRH